MTLAKNSLTTSERIKQEVSKFKPKSVIDLGCGFFPHLPIWCHKSGIEYLGVDINPDHIKMMRENYARGYWEGKQITLVLADVLEPLSLIEQADVVVSVDLIQYLRTQKKQFLQIAAGVARRGLVIASGNVAIPLPKPTLKWQEQYHEIQMLFYEYARGMDSSAGELGIFTNTLREVFSDDQISIQTYGLRQWSKEECLVGLDMLIEWEKNGLIPSPKTIDFLNKKIRKKIHKGYAPPAPTAIIGTIDLLSKRRRK